jgi:uncharacterized protein (DUF362 family)
LFVKTANNDLLFKMVNIPEILKKVDLFVSVPRLKLHGVSGNCRNDSNFLNEEIS